MGLDEDVGELAELKFETEYLEREAMAIEKEANFGRTIMHGAKMDIRRRMMEGERLKDPILDYAFFHYGSEVGGKEGKVGEFFFQLDRFRGQAILENVMGHTTSRPGHPNVKSDRTLNLGRLNLHSSYVITMSQREVYSTTERNYLATIGENWTQRLRNIILNPYIDGFVRGGFVKEEDVEPIDILLEEGAIKFPLRETLIRDSGFVINIGSPVVSERGIGGSVGYDSEPYRSLIVGDVPVREYLVENDFKVLSVSERKLEMPGNFD
jgi:hypothetical protein